MYKRLSENKRQYILSKIEDYEKKWNFVFPPNYRSFVSNFNKIIFPNAYVDEYLRVCSITHLEYSASSNSNGSIAFSTLADILEGIDSDVFPSLKEIDFDFPDLVDNDLSTYYMIGYSSYQGHYFVGIGPGNCDKIYKIDYEFERMPVFLANSIYEFVDKFYLKFNHDIDHYVKKPKAKYYEAKDHKFSLNINALQNCIHNRENNTIDYISFNSLIDNLHKFLDNV